MLTIFVFFVPILVNSVKATDAEAIFDDYFDEELKVIDIPQDLAVRSCVSNSSILVAKLDDAYNACFGSDDGDKDSDYDWNDFEINSDGHDSDKDGLSDDYEANEACFYSKMGWVKRNMANDKIILDDFKGLQDPDLYHRFQKQIRSCANWKGDFKRRKREASQSWSISLARNRRESAKKVKKENKLKGRNVQQRKSKSKMHGKNEKQNKPSSKVNKDEGERKISGRKNSKGVRKSRRKGKGGRKTGNQQNNGNGKDTKRRKGRKKTDKTQKSRRGNSKKNERKSGTKSKPNQGRNNIVKKTGKKDKKKTDKKGKKENRKKNEKKDEKKKAKDKTKTKVSKEERKLMKELLPENVYNQLWCFEVTVEKALKSCVEMKLMEDIEETLDLNIVEDIGSGFGPDYATYYTDY